MLVYWEPRSVSSARTAGTVTRCHAFTMVRGTPSNGFQAVRRGLPRGTNPERWRSEASRGSVLLACYVIEFANARPLRVDADRDLDACGAPNESTRRRRLASHHV